VESDDFYLGMRAAPPFPRDRTGNPFFSKFTRRRAAASPSRQVFYEREDDFRSRRDPPRSMLNQVAVLDCHDGSFFSFSPGFFKRRDIRLSREEARRIFPFSSPWGERKLEGNRRYSFFLARQSRRFPSLRKEGRDPLFSPSRPSLWGRGRTPPFRKEGPSASLVTPAGRRTTQHAVLFFLFFPPQLAVAR